MKNNTNFYNPLVEMMPRKELEKLQLNNLKRQLQYVYQNSEFYHQKLKQANIKPQDINTQKDLDKIPITTREEIQQKIKETKD
ncbi:MAG: hypothetical protein QXS27_08930, partial [Candidatus Jordarchaeaceae archaeon]